MKIERVSKSFGGLRALDEISMSVYDDQVAILMGPNGSGKTTLNNVIAGVYKPESGNVSFRAIDITGWPPHEVFRVGLVRTFQIPSPLTNLSVLENLIVARGTNPGEGFLRFPFHRYWLGYEKDSVEFAFKVLALLKLESRWDAKASELSGGETKLLEIGRALMSGAKMILMDEPVSGVNPTLAHEILAHIVGLRKDLGIAFLLIEHRLDIALQYVDYAFVMSRGRVISEGKVSDVLADPNVITAYLGS